MENETVILDTDINQQIEELKIKAEEIDAQIYFIPNVVVDYTRPYAKALMSACPETETKSHVLRLGNEYHEVEKGVVMESIVLLRLPNSGRPMKGYNWAIKNGLTSVGPQSLFAACEQKSGLIRSICPNEVITLSETTGYWVNGSAKICSTEIWNKHIICTTNWVKKLMNRYDFLVFKASL